MFFCYAGHLFQYLVDVESHVVGVLFDDFFEILALVILFGDRGGESVREVTSVLPDRVDLFLDPAVDAVHPLLEPVQGEFVIIAHILQLFVHVLVIQL